MNFGDKLKEIRVGQKLSQEQLAEKIGVSRQAITKWETNRGMPDIENMITLAKVFKITLDELILNENQIQEENAALYESETICDIDCDKRFDICIGSARKISVYSGEDEKLHVRLVSDSLENLSSLYKIKLDENKKKLDIDCVRKKGISRYEAEESVDVIIILPKYYTSHCEIEAAAKELYIEDLKLECLEYDGSAEKVFIRNIEGSLELTGKSDYDITISGKCTHLDVNQWCAKTVIHMDDVSKYKMLNKGRKCGIYQQKDGTVYEGCFDGDGENILSISGIRSELIIDSRL